LGLLLEDGGVAGKVLRELGLETERVREMSSVSAARGLTKAARSSSPPIRKKCLNMPLMRLGKWATTILVQKHLLLGLVRSEGAAMEVLKKLGVTPDQVRRQTRRVLQESTGTGASAVPETAKPGGKQEPKTPLVDQLATDLTTLAEEGKTGPGDWPPDRDRACHSDPGPPHQEQPGPDRRAGRWQDGHCRRAGPANHGWRCTRAALKQTRPETGCRFPGGRDDVPRPVRGTPEARHRRTQVYQVDPFH